MSLTEKQRRINRFFAAYRESGLPITNFRGRCARCRQKPRARQRRPNAQRASAGTDTLR